MSLSAAQFKRVWAAVPAEPARAVTVAILCLGLFASLAASLPGHMSYDSVLQLAQGRTGLFNNWHPPIMAWLLGAFDHVVRGTALFVLFDTVLIYGALLVLVLVNPRTSWPAAAIALVWAAIPDGLIYPGTVWKDVLFAATATSGFALLAALEKAWPRPPLRFGLIAAAFLLLALAAMTRQNGAVVLPIAAAALGWIAASSGAGRPWRTALAYGLAPLAAAGVIMFGANAALQAHSDGEPSQAYQLEDLETYDLAAALQMDPGLRLDLIRAANPMLERLMRQKAAGAYTPVRLDPVTSMADLQQAMSDTPMSTVARQWRRLVIGHPLLYLRIRLLDFAWVVLTPDIEVCLPYYVGVDGPQPWLSRLGLSNAVQPRDVALKDYADPLTHTPVASHATYAVAAVAVLSLLLRRRRPADIAVAGLIVSALLFVASFFLISVACDYRYLYFLDVAAVAGALYLVAGGRTGSARVTPWEALRRGGRRGFALRRRPDRRTGRS